MATHRDSGGSGRGRGCHRQHDAEEEVCTSTSQYRCLTAPKVQEWLDRIDVEAQEVREQDEGVRVKASEEDYWCPDFSTARTRHL